MQHGFSCWLTVVVFMIACYGQTDSTTGEARRPRIGLVLEGGGALGLAHIGVLQWLEEHRIPVEYVSGTSMGRLVGDLYATGHTPAEVKAMVRSIDWDKVLQGNTPYKDLSYRRKQDAFDYPNSLEFGLKKGLQFPESFNSGQDVVMILDRVSLPYSDVSDFNDLPIPFACVVTDLVTSKKFVFRQGSLSVALRSTMSLPGIFSPVRWNAHIFADGGLMDNLPVDVAKQMGATLTVAVHLETAKLEPDASLSSFGVLGSSISTVVAANEMLSIEQADILIAVPLQKYGSLDYKPILPFPDRIPTQGTETTNPARRRRIFQWTIRGRQGVRSTVQITSPGRRVGSGARVCPISRDPHTNPIAVSAHARHPLFNDYQARPCHLAFHLARRHRGGPGLRRNGVDGTP